MKRDKRKYTITYIPIGRVVDRSRAWANLDAWTELTKNNARIVYNSTKTRCRVTGEAKANTLATAMRMRGLTVEVKTYTKRRRKK